jgi:hypothetical protein
MWIACDDELVWELSSPVLAPLNTKYAAVKKSVTETAAPRT